MQLTYYFAYINIIIKIAIAIIDLKSAIPLYSKITNLKNASFSRIIKFYFLSFILNFKLLGFLYIKLLANLIIGSAL